MWHEAVRSLVRSVGRDGVRASLQLVRARWRDRSFDHCYGTDTYRWVAPGDFCAGVPDDAAIEPYKPSHAAGLRRLFRELRVGPNDVLLDVGSGKGRVLMVAAEFAVNAARGIELSPRLTTIARRNLARFCEIRRPSTSFSLVCGDMRDHALRDDETLVYLFNPFGAALTDHLAAKVTASLARRPRPLRLVYRAPEHRCCFDASPALLPADRYSFDGQEYLVYFSRHGDRGAEG